MQWPAFAVFTLLDAFVLDRLSPVTNGLGAESTGLNYIEGLLLATFGNLFLVGVVAPFLSRRLARRAEPVAAGGVAAPPEAQRAVIRDRVATALLAAGLAGTIAAGLGNRPAIVSATDDSTENARQVRRYVIRSGSAELARNLETADTIRLGTGFFRTCIARDDRRRRLCLLVDVKKDPPQVRRDPSAEPNAVFSPATR